MFLHLHVFFCGIWAFSSNRKHLLATLFSLGFTVLILYISIHYCLNYYNFELYFRIIFLTFSVCEGALGLSILVSIIRGYGRDFFGSYRMLQC